MNLIEFNKILSRPGQIKKDQINGLYTIIEKYPYFQAAHFLHLNGLKNRHSFKYNDYLKLTAAYTTDRSVLFDYITSDDFDIHPAPADLIPLDPEVKTETKPKTKFETRPETKPDEVEEVVEVAEVLEVVEDLEDETRTKKATEPSPEATLKIGEPLKFGREETFSFRQWLQLSHLEPIERKDSVSATEPKTVPIPEKKEPQALTNTELIDRFISSSPKITPSILDSYSNTNMDSVPENENLMTETLAHVYVEQKKYQKAITAFTVLSLKYPEKSSFFALQIEAIKKLQEK